MSESLITKKALGEAMKRLMIEQPFEKISVRDICNECGMNRNSFYYHFRDKQDLVFWIFDFEFIQKVHSTNYGDPFSLIESLAEYFYDNRAYYLRAFAFTGQNCFSDYFTEVFTQLCAEQIDKYFGESVDCELYARFTADTIRITLVRWLGEDEVTPKKLTAMVRDAFIMLSERGVQLFPEEIDRCRREREKREKDEK